jgi:hypothetical protein
MLNIPAEYERDISFVKFKDISRQVFFAVLLLGVSAGYCQRTLVGELGMIITHREAQQIGNGRSV